MATGSSRWCGRCQLVHPGRCPEVKAWSTGRQLVSGRGGSKWRTRRERIFKRDKFLCQICLAVGRLKPVALSGSGYGVCDHIVPKFEGGTDDDDNLQTICQDCDRVKTAAESKRGRGG